MGRCVSARRSTHKKDEFLLDNHSTAATIDGYEKTVLALIACATIVANAATGFQDGAGLVKLPEGQPALGNQHGDVAVSARARSMSACRIPGRPAGARRTGSSAERTRRPATFTDS
jgi:hypothetical protein